MSNKYLEYLKLVPKGIKNLPELIDGIKNEVALNHNNLPEEIQEVITQRRLICATCPFMSENAKTSEEYKQLFKGHSYTTSRKEEHCSLCGCITKLKTASLESDCGLEYYNIEFPENKQELKWTKYEK